MDSARGILAIMGASGSGKSTFEYTRAWIAPARQYLLEGSMFPSMTKRRWH